MWNAVANLGVADLLSLSELEISPGHASLELDHCGQCGAGCTTIVVGTNGRTSCLQIQIELPV